MDQAGSDNENFRSVTMTTAGVLAPRTELCGCVSERLLTNMDSASSPALLKLSVENRKRNVFVTQLEEHRLVTAVASSVHELLTLTDACVFH